MKNDLMCFSHLRWNFVYQRPQHLMTRAAKKSRVFYFEEPVYTSFPDKLKVHVDPVNQVTVVTPELEEGEVYIVNEKELTVEDRIARLLDQLIQMYKIKDFVSWYYAPMALSFTQHLKPRAVVYDCMDELSAFKFAPPELVTIEKKLMSTAGLVFTGGHRLYNAKKDLHHNIHPFPSAIDKQFFYPARTKHAERPDQKNIPHPRLGFFGVIDERFDIDLVRRIAGLKPDWHFVFIGPVVKIDAESLPRNQNIHYLGMKDYAELPTYISGWDLCIMPFAINASTEFISPTKTPEFLAAGKRVISTPIHDVVHPYGVNGLVGIADEAESFVEIAEHDLRHTGDDLWLGKVDQYLSGISWDKTWINMEIKIDQLLGTSYLNLVKRSAAKSNTGNEGNAVDSSRQRVVERAGSKKKSVRA
jgi:hypothetical protein